MALADNVSVQRITPDGIEQAGDSLTPLIESLRKKHAQIARIPVARFLALFDHFAERLLHDPQGSGRWQ
jgi:hypothetical protein